MKKWMKIALPIAVVVIVGAWYAFRPERLVVLDLAKYRAVSIWCKRFSVNFGAAALRPADASQNR
jgi:hypothetical protein